MSNETTEAVARTMFEYECPDGSWEKECRLEHASKGSYLSQAPRYRQLAETALATFASVSK